MGKQFVTRPAETVVLPLNLHSLIQSCVGFLSCGFTAYVLFIVDASHLIGATFQAYPTRSTPFFYIVSFSGQQCVLNAIKTCTEAWTRHGGVEASKLSLFLFALISSELKPKD
jgi:hypothetical protein